MPRTTSTENRPGREWLVVLFSLLLAFFIWSVHNLSLEYSAYLQYKVNLKVEMEGYADKAAASEMLIVRGRATGFEILSQKFGKGREVTLDIELEPSLLHKVEGETEFFYVNTQECLDKIAEAADRKIDIDFVETPKLTFLLPRRSFKMVPVVARRDISFKPQYMMVNEIVLEPDSVRVYGDLDKLGNVDAVYTSMITLEDVDKSIRSNVDLEPLYGFRIDRQKVKYSFVVARYVEIKSDVTVTSVNVPEGRKLLALPSQVTATYRIPFGKVGRGNADIVPEFGVYYEDFISSRSSKVIPRLVRYPGTIYSYSLEPAFVECIMMER
ncbi:MAG: YbbR-like domain-containing protein [Bacteroidales bacterium]|nr:YbbR-like domain-containing protein [Bacteroidales bacterium]